MRVRIPVRRIFAAMFAAAILPILTTCSTGEEGHRFRIIEEDSVPVHLTLGGPKYEEELFEYERVLRITDDDPEDPLFERPMHFLADASGRLYVYDFGPRQILVFGPAGELLQRISRPGQGPGENNAGSLLPAGDGRIALLESLGTRRTQRWSWEGELLDVVSFPAGAPLIGIVDVRLLDSGRQLLISAGEEMRRPGYRRVSAVVLSADGDTMASVRAEPVQTSLTRTVAFGGQEMVFPSPIIYGPWPMAVWSDAQGLVISDGHGPRLSLYDLDGRPAKGIRLEIPTESVSEAEREAARAILLKQAEGGNPGVKAAVDAQVEAMVFADEKSPWTEIEVDANGWFWLQVAVPMMGREGITSREYRVLDARGEYMGNTTRPAGPAHRVMHGRLLVLERNEETGEMFPTVYEIRSAIRGLVYP